MLLKLYVLGMLFSYLRWMGHWKEMKKKDSGFINMKYFEIVSRLFSLGLSVGSWFTFLFVLIGARDEEIKIGI